MNDLRKNELAMLYVVANKIWKIAGISPEYGNAVMDLLGEETYKKVAELTNVWEISNGFGHGKDIEV